MTLPGSVHNLTKSGFLTAIELLGRPTVWTQAVPPSATATMTMGFKTAGKDDTEVVNAYGWGTVIITGMAKDFPVAPVKFDTFELGGVKYVASAAHPISLNAELIGYKIYAKGVT